MLNDTLYDALQGFEMKLAMQYNRCMELPCRQIVRTSMTVASVMLQDDNVEQNRDTYLRLINRLMDGSQQERIMVLIVTIALFGLLDTPQARRCRNTLRNDECEAFDEYLSLYEQFLASNDTRFSAEDFELDTNNLLYNPQPLIIMKEKEIQQTVNHYHGPYIANNYVQDGGNQILSAENVYWSGTNDPQIGSILMPQEGNYDALVRWLAQEKAQGRDHYANADFNRSKMCRNLLKIIGWEPNQDSLRKAQNR